MAVETVSHNTHNTAPLLWFKYHQGQSELTLIIHEGFYYSHSVVFCHPLSLSLTLSLPPYSDPLPSPFPFLSPHFHTHSDIFPLHLFIALVPAGASDSGVSASINES